MLACVFVVTFSHAEPETLQGVVNFVYDGDTIKIGKERIRLVGLDTPELNTRKKTKGPECFAQEAKNYLMKKIFDKEVLVVTDDINTKRDKFGRLLGYVYLKKNLINAELIQHGFASAFTVFPFTKKSEFVDLQEKAQKNHVGMWQACDVKCWQMSCKTKFRGALKVP